MHNLAVPDSNDRDEPVVVGCAGSDEGSSGWPKTNPRSDKNTPRALAIDWLLVSESTYREVQAFRLASADLLGFASRLRNESGHNLWL